MKYEIVFPGFPGRMLSGTMGWSSAVYIESGRDKILFDTAGPGRRIRIRERLHEMGVDTKEINLLILSHFHYDHAYNVDYFPNATIILHEIESDWVRGNPDDYAIPPHLYQAVQQTGRLMLFRDDQEIAPGVETFLAPGHTPGGIALLLRDADMPATVIAGDAVKNMAELATGHVPTAWDVAISAQSIKKIRDVAEVVIPGHDRALKVTDDEIVALTVLHETIVIPPGVVNADWSSNLELVVERNRLPKKAIGDGTVPEGCDPPFRSCR